MNQKEDLTTDRMNYPRMSEVIHAYTRGAYESVPMEVLVHAQERGTKVHGYAAASLKGLFLPEIDDECGAYLESFLEWKEAARPKPKIIEERFYDDDLKFSGQADLICTVGNGKDLVLVDLKTSANPSKAWPIQLAAYKHLAEVNGLNIQRALVVQPKVTKKKDAHGKIVFVPGKPKVYEFDDLDAYWEVFSSALICYNYFLRKDVK